MQGCMHYREKGRRMHYREAHVTCMHVPAKGGSESLYSSLIAGGTKRPPR